MRKGHSLFFKCAVIIAFISIIISPSTAFNGTITGIRLWGATIFPALFPALIITGCILKLFPMNTGASYAYIIISGLLCGFPLGAYLCSSYHSSVKNEKICIPLSAFCNISSPSFIINYIINQIIAGRVATWKILTCVYAPVIECIAVLLFIHRNDIKKSLTPQNNILKTNKISQHTTSNNNTKNSITSKSQLKSKNSDISTKQNNISSLDNTTSNNTFSMILDNSITNSINSMLKLAGYIIVFSCLSQYILLLPINNLPIKTLLCSISEITNGIFLCSRLDMDITHITILIITINAFGGLSTLMQTNGITKGMGFNIKTYFYGKIILTIVTFINSIFIIKL